MSLKEFRGTGDPSNIMGISALVTDYDEIKSNVDLSQIEHDIVNRMKKTKHRKSAPEIFRQELDNVLKGIDGVKLYDIDEVDEVAMKDRFSKSGGGTRKGTKSTTKIQFRSKPGSSKADSDSDFGPPPGLRGLGGSKSKSRQKPQAKPQSESEGEDEDEEADSDEDSEEDSDENGSDISSKRTRKNDREGSSYSGWMSSRNSPYVRQHPKSRSKMQGQWYNKRTHEENAQDVISSVLGRGGGPATNDQDKELEEIIAKEQEKDLKSMLIAQYDLLKTSLTEEQVDLSRVPAVTESSSLSVINAALRMLRYKNDLRRYVSIGEDIILFMSYGLESAFDGQTNYFGTKPDLRGWSDSVKPRIKRMRADTSQVVSNLMNQFNFGSLTRMMLELVPSAFLYSRTKGEQTKGAVSDTEWRDSIHKLDQINPK